MSLSATSNVPIEFMPNIGKRTAKVLRSLGIGTIGQFVQLPERLLIELFGPSIRSTLADPLVVPESAIEASSRQAQGVSAGIDVAEKRHLPLLKRLQLATQLVTLL